MRPRRSLTAQLQEVERELAMRARVYPQRVAARRMREGEADEHCLRLECVRDTLRWLQKNEARIKAALTVEDGGA
jgi:hypothetical protein